jgi:hypothetical protein
LIESFIDGSWYASFDGQPCLFLSPDRDHWVLPGPQRCCAASCHIVLLADVMAQCSFHTLERYQGLYT